MITDKLKALSEILEHSSQLVPQLNDVFFMDRSFSPEINEKSYSDNVWRKKSLVELAHDYQNLAANWLHERKVDESIKIFSEKLDLNLITIDEIALELDVLQEWLDEIDHFMMLIPVKIKRAVTSSCKQERWELENGLPKDCDGSAKITVLAIDRSIEVWEKLMAYFPQLEDDCLDFLVRLQHLKELTLKEFPNAMRFIRPGFDQSLD